MTGTVPELCRYGLIQSSPHLHVGGAVITPFISDEKAEAQEHLATRQGHMGLAAQHKPVSVA